MNTLTYHPEASSVTDDTYLVVANAYPSSGALYRNGFIHRRVLGYLAAGEHVAVYYLHPPAPEEYTYTHEGVHVTVGNAEHYVAHLERHVYRKFLVHFATPSMILPIAKIHPTTPVITWIHGMEAEAWHRRWFNVLDSAQDIRNLLKRRKSHYEAQLAFLNWFYQTDEIDATFVHVSSWFQKHIAEPDAGATTRKSVVIPNVIDENSFPYRLKRPEDRLHVLSIRPYASRKYANDLTVKAILELSKRPYFKELSFTLIGDGKYFDSTVAPLRKFTANVTLSKGFIDQAAISEVHAKHGVFLAPTRFDSQGVSLGEAMSSGLVPVSTDIAAIPEFITHRGSGLLAAPESYLDLANHIEALYFDPELFLELSESAAESITTQCGTEATINPELELLRS